MMSTFALIPTSANAQTPQGVWYTMYSNDVYIPTGGRMIFTVNDAPYAIKVSCMRLTGSSVGEFFIFKNNVQIDTKTCSSAEPMSVFQYVGLKTTTIRVEFKFGGVYANLQFGDMRVKIEGYEQISTTIGTPQPTQTFTPATPVPTTAGATGPGYNGTPMPIQQQCGVAGTPACQVEVINLTPGTGGTGGTGSGGAVIDATAQALQSTMIALQKTEVAIMQQPTPTFTPTPTPLPTPKPVAYTGGSERNILADANAVNQGDNWTAAMIVKDWDFGCPIDVSGNGIISRICFKYAEVTSIRMLGFDLPLTPLVLTLLGLSVFAIIRNK